MRTNIFMKEISTKKYGVVIVAGGSGKRFGGELPKQFLPVREKPVLMRTIEQFHKTFSGIHIVVVLPGSHIDVWNKLCSEHNFSIDHTIVQGGKERFWSVKNGLNALSECELVAVHDGVRPLASEALIAKCFETAQRHGTCVPVIPETDSLRKGNFSNNQPVCRKNLYRVQTPQVFKFSWLKKSYNQPFSENFTDDASVVERAGFQIILTEGEEENIKITQQKDLDLAEFFLKKQL